jgi:hypothetical protein
MVYEKNLPSPSPIEKAPVRRFIGWFLGFDAAEKALTAEQAATPISAAHVQRARVALELADRALDDVEPLHSGPGAAVALSMIRESVYWALIARSPPGPSRSLATAFDSADRDLLTACAGDDGLVEPIRAALVERTFVETAELDRKTQARDARRARAFADALIASLDERSSSLTRVVARRRAALALAATMGLGLVILVLQPWKWSDLAAGKTWHTSTQSDCDVTFGYCGGKFVNLLFHTTEEDSPWAEVDLGRPKQFTSVDIRNREDCCKERAVPLVVQSSNDRESWKELGRQTTEFDVWNLTFPAETARYVRVVAERRTMLHLKSIRVH